MADSRLRIATTANGTSHYMNTVTKLAERFVAFQLDQAI